MKVRGRGRRRRAAGWLVLLAGALLVWVFLWAPGFSWTTRWGRVMHSMGRVEVEWGNEVDRRALDELRNFRYDSNAPDQFYMRGEWDVRVPEAGVFDAPVTLVCFPVWPLACLSLVSGGWLVWSVRRRCAGQCRVVAGSGAIAVGLLLACSWVWSGWNISSRRAGGVDWTVWHGLVVVGADNGYYFSIRQSALLKQRTAGLASALGSPAGAYWLVWGWARVDPTAPLSTGVVVPIWPFAVLAIGSGCVCVRLGVRARRRARTGRCAACGYDLRGLEAGTRCPECGA